MFHERLILLNKTTHNDERVTIFSCRLLSFFWMDEVEGDVGPSSFTNRSSVCLASLRRVFHVSKSAPARIACPRIYDPSDTMKGCHHNLLSINQKCNGKGCSEPAEGFHRWLLLLAATAIKTPSSPTTSTQRMMMVCFVDGSLVVVCSR